MDVDVDDEVDDDVLDDVEVDDEVEVELDVDVEDEVEVELDVDVDRGGQNALVVLRCAHCLRSLGGIPADECGWRHTLGECG